MWCLVSYGAYNMRSKSFRLLAMSTKAKSNATTVENKRSSNSAEYLVQK